MSAGAHKTSKGLPASSLQAGAIDVHTHICAPTFPDDPTGGLEPGWPCMACSAGGASVMIDGRLFRTLDDRSWNIARRIEDMDRDGVSVQALSPMPELLSYWFDEQRTLLMCDHMNGFIGEAVAQAPDRFCGLGMVPLQFPRTAAAYLPRLKGKFGMHGVEIGSNILGTLPGDRRHDPFFAAAQDLDLAIFIHALHPLATTTVAQPAWFTPAIGFPLDVGMAAASVIGEGVTERFPRLRIGFSHGGGALASILGRMDRAWGMTSGFGGALSRTPSAVAGDLFYDSNVYDPATLRHLIGDVAPGHVFLGTDYPYDIMQTDPLSYLRKVDSPQPLSPSLTRDAAIEFLGLGA